MSWPVNGKTVFVTGAARGIGAESAPAGSTPRAAINVALVGLEPEELRSASPAELGDRVAAFESRRDRQRTPSRARRGRRAVERFGGIDVAIANAGINMSGTIPPMAPCGGDRAGSST